MGRCSKSHGGGSNCSSMRFLKGFRENWAIQTHRNFTCMLGQGLRVLDHQVVSFHTIESLLIFCFIVSLELKLF